MSENEQPQPAAAEKPEQQFAIQRVYVKDLSFETPNSPAIFTEKWEPALNVEINSAATQVQEGVYEVILRLTVTCKVGEKTAYLAEVQQAGIFAISGFEPQPLSQMIHSFCPNILFPYGREAISDLVNRGSFPQMLLAPVNFDALYAQHLQKLQQQQESEAGVEPQPESPSIH